MRQLAAEGWMHNRVRMIVASFLVKDLHLPWQRGARHFLAHLVDADLASNQHGWQWTAGTGTDASPFYRVFNPTTQGERFDPDGDYVRRYVPELRGIRRWLSLRRFSRVRESTIKRFGIDDESVAAAHAKLRAAGERFRAELQPSGYLVGDRFTVADLTLASIVASRSRLSPRTYSHTATPPAASPLTASAAAT